MGEENTYANIAYTCSVLRAADCACCSCAPKLRKEVRRLQQMCEELAGMIQKFLAGPDS